MTANSVPVMSSNEMVKAKSAPAKIAGNNSHHGSGEIWAWTLEYKGQSQHDQVYEGDDDGYPLLVE